MGLGQEGSKDEDTIEECYRGNMQEDEQKDDFKEERLSREQIDGCLLKLCLALVGLGEGQVSWEAEELAVKYGVVFIVPCVVKL